MRFLLYIIFVILLFQILYGCASHTKETSSANILLTKRTDSAREMSPSDNNLSSTLVIDSLTLEDAINAVIQNNPELKAMEKDIDVAKAHIIQAKLLPNPSLFMETEDGQAKSIGFGDGYKSVIGISQPIPLGGKIKARTKVAQKEHDIALINYEQKLRDAIANTKIAFAKIIANQQSVVNISTALDIATKVHDSINIRVTALVTPQTDLIKAEIFLSQTSAKFTNARTELLQSQKQLSTLLGNPNIEVGNYSGKLRETFSLLDKSRVEKAFLSSFPELIRAKLDKELAQRHLILAKADGYPDIDIEVGTGKLRETSESSNILEWALTLPLPVFNRNQGQIKEAKALLTKREKEYQNITNKLLLELVQTISIYDSLLSQVKTYQDRIIPKSVESLSFVSLGYQEGRFSYLELLDAQRTLTETKEAYLEILENLNNASIEIERLSGKSIDELQ